jgi:hypothetical protein
MLAALRPFLVTIAAVIRHANPRRLAEHTVLRSKHWPSDGIARQAFLAAASICAAVLLIASAIHPNKMIWS